MDLVFAKLIAHLGWADAAVLAALQEASEASPDWLELYAHVLGAEHVWLCRAEGRASTLAVWPRLTLEECARAAEENLQGWRNLVGRLTPEGLKRSVHYRNSAGQEFNSSVEDIMLQVCLHGAYHRGQIARAMREGGATPAPTDYIGFIRGVPAATRQGPQP
jgi:uncharacterized damage-inducible protein DinB